MKRIIKTFYNFINESEAVPTGAEIVDILTTVFGSTVSYGDPNVYHMYIVNPAIKTSPPGAGARVDVNLSGRRFVFTGKDLTRPDDRREIGSVLFNFLLAAGAKQIPYKKKDGTFGGYLNNVLSYDGLSKTQIKKMIADLHAKYPWQDH